VDESPGFYRDLAPQEKPEKKTPHGQKYPKNGFSITEKTDFYAGLG
jgi:hypothetical protein